MYSIYLVLWLYFSETKEHADKLATDSKTLELQEKLQTAMSEIELMKESRERQAGIVESIIQQRDMLKSMLGQGADMREQVH